MLEISKGSLVKLLSSGRLREEMTCFLFLGFDLVDHNVLLSELSNLDVDPHLVRWIAAFLTNRNQRVRVGNSLSPPVGLMAGHLRVPNSPPCSSAF